MRSFAQRTFNTLQASLLLQHPNSSPPSVMGRLKGWIKRQTPFKDERSITDSRTGGTTSNDKSIYSHYVDSELDRLTPVPSHKLTRAHDFPLIDHSDEVSCEMPDNRSPSHFKDHRRGRSSRKSTKKPPTPHHWREQGSRLSVKESEFERNMALTFLCLRLQSIKVDEERLRRLENTLLSSGQPSLSAKEAMEWLLSHGDRIQQNARKASEKLRVVLADISIPVERAVKVLEIFVRNGTLFRKKHSEIKCTEFFGFRKIVSMDDITDILYHLAREQMYREFRTEDFIA
uniref:DEP domain-containing protein n=2 Tax=Parascaris univalens TaxID=6257 RepID=A0A915CIY2_PARUN